MRKPCGVEQAQVGLHESGGIKAAAGKQQKEHQSQAAEQGARRCRFWLLAKPTEHQIKGRKGDGSFLSSSQAP
jgi:hypothetical protein